MKKLILIILLISPSAFAEWSFNIGYNNPPGAQVGANFCYFWTKWAFELGIGSVRTTSTDSSGTQTSSVSVGGDLNFKYLFGSGLFRPYLQAGAGAGVAASSGVSAGAGGGFGGGGFFLKGSDLYAYFSYNVGGSGFFQGGIGVYF